MLGTALLVVATLSRVSVYQCAMTGDLCLDGSCCTYEDDTVDEDCSSCCSDNNNADFKRLTSYGNDQCCVEFSFDFDLLDDIQTVRVDSLTDTVSFDHFSEFLDSLDQDESNQIRGSPQSLYSTK